MYRHHIPRLGNRAAELRPIIHHALAFFHQVTTPVGRFHLVTNGMGQRHLGNVSGIVGLLGPPRQRMRTYLPLGWLEPSQWEELALTPVRNARCLL